MVNDELNKQIFFLNKQISVSQMTKISLYLREHTTFEAAEYLQQKYFKSFLSCQGLNPKPTTPPSHWATKWAIQTLWKHKLCLVSAAQISNNWPILLFDIGHMNLLILLILSYVRRLKGLTFSPLWVAMICYLKLLVVAYHYTISRHWKIGKTFNNKTKCSYKKAE